MWCLVGANGMEWVKMKEIFRDKREVLEKKMSACKIVIDEIGEDIEYRREWSISSQIGGVLV